MPFPSMQVASSVVHPPTAPHFSVVSHYPCGSVAIPFYNEFEFSKIRTALEVLLASLHSHLPPTISKGTALLAVMGTTCVTQQSCR